MIQLLFSSIDSLGSRIPILELKFLKNVSHGGAKPSFVSSAEKVHLILKRWEYGTQILTELHLHGKLPIKLSVGVKASTWRR